MKYYDINTIKEDFPVGSFIAISFRRYNNRTPDTIIGKVKEFFTDSDNYIKVLVEYGLTADGKLEINSTFGIATNDVRLANDTEIKVLKNNYLKCDDAIKNIIDNIHHLSSEQKKLFLHYLIDKMF